MSRQVIYSVRREPDGARTQADAVDAAAEWARMDEFRVRGTVDAWRTFDGWQVALEVEPIRVEVTA